MFSRAGILAHEQEASMGTGCQRLPYLPVVILGLLMGRCLVWTWVEVFKTDLGTVNSVLTLCGQAAGVAHVHEHSSCIL